jgi:hypothetical protein
MELVLGLVIGFLGGLAAGFGLNLMWQKRGMPATSHKGEPAAAGQGDNLLESILGGSAGTPVKTEADRIAELRQNLRVKFLHDENQVEQAITREREHAPDGSMVQWLEAAIFRWERENR